MILQILNSIHWTAPVCHTAHLKTVCINIKRCINTFLFACYNCTVFLICLSGVLPWPRAGSNHLLALLDPLSNMLQMLQECSQLELALRVLVNSYGSCLQHVTSNVMDIKLSVQVWLQHQVSLLALISWNSYTVNILY